MAAPTYTRRSASHRRADSSDLSHPRLAETHIRVDDSNPLGALAFECARCRSMIIPKSSATRFTVRPSGRDPAAEEDAIWCSNVDSENVCEAPIAFPWPSKRAEHRTGSEDANRRKISCRKCKNFLGFRKESADGTSLVDSFGHGPYKLFYHSRGEYNLLMLDPAQWSAIRAAIPRAVKREQKLNIEHDFTIAKAAGADASVLYPEANAKAHEILSGIAAVKSASDSRSVPAAAAPASRGDGTPLAYRATRRDESARKGLHARAPDDSGSFEHHILNGSKPGAKTRWISLSLSVSKVLAWALPRGSAVSVHVGAATLLGAKFTFALGTPANKVAVHRMGVSSEIGAEGDVHAAVCEQVHVKLVDVRARTALLAGFPLADASTLMNLRTIDLPEAKTNWNLTGVSQGAEEYAWVPGSPTEIDGDKDYDSRAMHQVLLKQLQRMHKRMQDRCEIMLYDISYEVYTERQLGPPGHGLDSWLVVDIPAALVRLTETSAADRAALFAELHASKTKCGPKRRKGRSGASGAAATTSACGAARAAASLAVPAAAGSTSSAAPALAAAASGASACSPSSS